MRYKVNIKLGKKIKKFRQERKMSQEELADKVGLHYTRLSRIEWGEARNSFKFELRSCGGANFLASNNYIKLEYKRLSQCRKAR